MTHPQRRTANAVTLALLMTACGPLGGNEARAPRLISVTASGPVTVAVGDTLAITLPANPSTGFQWETDTLPDARVLVAAGELAYAPSPNQPPMPGAGGTATFRYRALASGETRLTLAYRRSWEKGVPPVERVTVTVTVAPSGH